MGRHCRPLDGDITTLSAGPLRGPQLTENLIHQAPIGDAALEQIGPDEQGEPQPIDVLKHRTGLHAERQRQA